MHLKTDPVLSKLIEKFDRVGITLLTSDIKIINSKLKDKIFVLTGSLILMTRE